jgi:hypothetical protein
MTCPTCGGIGWLCEDHPKQPHPHEGCAGPGVPCPDCNADEPPRLPEGWTSIARITADPEFAVNCPECGTATDYVRSEAGPMHIYRCRRHGLIMLPPSGIGRVMPQ